MTPFINIKEKEMNKPDPLMKVTKGSHFVRFNSINPRVVPLIQHFFTNYIQMSRMNDIRTHPDIYIFPHNNLLLNNTEFILQIC